MKDNKVYKKPKVLFYAPILEYPPAGGPQLSVINAIKVLSRISELHIITVVSPQMHKDNDIKVFFKRYINNIEYAPSSYLHSKNHTIERIIRISRRLFPFFFTLVDARFIARYTRKNKIELFWIDRVIEHSYSIFKCLKYKFPLIPIIGDTEAVHSRFILRELPLIYNPARKMYIYLKGKMAQAQERKMVAMADAVTAVSDIDVAFYKELTKNPEKILKFSNVIDLADFKDVHLPIVDLKQPAVLLLGSFGHKNSPMDRAAKWLADDIMPIVWSKVPNAHLYIIGRNSQLTQANLNSDKVTVVGQVKSIVPYLQRAKLTLVPLRFESGTRFKIVESGAASVPCVSTTLGAEGLDLLPNENILIADTTENFADAIILVLSDPKLGKSLGEKLHEQIREKYSIETQTIEGQKILNYIKDRVYE